MPGTNNGACNGGQWSQNGLRFSMEYVRTGTVNSFRPSKECVPYRTLKGAGMTTG